MYREEREAMILQAVSVFLSKAAEGRVACDHFLALDSRDGNKERVSSFDGAPEPGQSSLFGARAVVEVADGAGDLVVDDDIDLGHVSLGCIPDGVCRSQCHCE